MRKLIAVSLVAGLLASCVVGIVGPFTGVTGNGNLATETRSISGFRSIDASGAVRVHVGEGPFSVTVRADSNLLPILVTEVRFGVLRIGWKPGTNVRTASHTDIDVTLPGLSAIKGSGATSFELEPFSGADFSVDLSGASSVRGNLGYRSVKLETSGASVCFLNVGDAHSLVAEASGGSRLVLGGSAADFRADLSGATTMEANNLAAVNADIRASGSSVVSVSASSSLRGELSGTSHLRYRGFPAVSVRTSGGSTVRSM